MRTDLRDSGPGARTGEVSRRGRGWGLSVGAWLQRGGPMRTHVPHAGVTRRAGLILKGAGWG